MTTALLENGNVLIATCTGRLGNHAKMIDAMKKDEFVKSWIDDAVSC